MKRWPQYLCYLFGHGRIEVLSSGNGRCVRCWYIGGINPDTGRLYWS